MQRIVGIGHSHLHGISNALREYAKAQPGRIDYTAICLLDAPYTPPFTHAKGINVPNPAWIAALRERLQDGGATVFLCLAGSEAWRWSLTPGPEPFDFVDPLHDDGEAPIGQLIPYELYMQSVRQRLAFVRQVVDVVRSVALVPMMQMLTPPPVADLAPLVASSLQRQDLVALIRDYGISPASFRLKVWRAVTRAITEVFAEIGVACVPVPEAGTHEGGYLRPELAADVVHGNTGWGRLRIGPILAAAEPKEEAA